MIQTIYTRKNYIAISLAIFFSLLLLFSGFCLNAGSEMINASNPIAQLSAAIGFEPIIPGTAGFITLSLVAFYIIIATAALIYERRYAIVNNKSPRSAKMLGVYALTVLICCVLSLGVGILFQQPISWENVRLLLLYG